MTEHQPSHGVNVQPSRGERILEAIHDDVNRLLNPNDEECWHCGGEGETHECIDGCCVDAESGCSECSRPCRECVINAGQRARAVREEVIKLNDVETAIAWLKSIGRWREGISQDQVAAELAKASEGHPAHSERASTPNGETT